MNIEDLLIPAPHIKCEDWQLGSHIKGEVLPGGIALIFCSDERGAGRSSKYNDFEKTRMELYALSKQDWNVPVSDLGDFISGKTVQDTHFALQEILSYCFKLEAIPVVIGGSNSLAHALFMASRQVVEDLQYVQVSHILHLKNQGEQINDKNFLAKIFEVENQPLSDYCHLGLQIHANNEEVIQLMKEVDFEVVRLAQMVNSPEDMEPYFRHADMVTFNCDAVESFADSFSLHPQVNGLNRREICTFTKEAGLSERLKTVGIFNFDFQSKNRLNHQLLAQMIWYLIDGINIRKSHPTKKNLETFWVMHEGRELAFLRDTFTNLWYFGNSEELSECVPCAKQDYENAKEGKLSKRILNHIS